MATRSKALPKAQVKELVRALEALENVLEDSGAYSPKFLASLDRAMSDVQAGRARRVRSLNELR